MFRRDASRLREVAISIVETRCFASLARHRPETETRGIASLLRNARHRVETKTIFKLFNQLNAAATGFFHLRQGIVNVNE
ncbi:hypothetical protein BGS_1295 [Beggiatoa sp. SS]|nr:hypothetical protein BGS_1295 [Beggiatoa sp. SS]